MFNEKHTLSNSGLKLAFIPSNNIKAYPCGRRRSELVDKDKNSDTISDQYYIPFDPEARLNTEANNRKHSSLNGFTQTYLNSWENNSMSLALKGYLFNITLDSQSLNLTNVSTKEEAAHAFGNKLAEFLGVSNSATKLYANVRLEDIPLFSGFADYSTEILRNQSDTATPSTCLDLILSSAASSSSADKTDIQNYYFSGLSFSAEPITSDKNLTRSEEIILKDGKPYQQLVSLLILERPSTTANWVIHEPARLPHIEHGSAENSVKVDVLEANSIMVQGTSVAALEVLGPTNNKYQLQFYINK